MYISSVSNGYSLFVPLNLVYLMPKNFTVISGVSSMCASVLCYTNKFKNNFINQNNLTKAYSPGNECYTRGKCLEHNTS